MMTCVGIAVLFNFGDEIRRQLSLRKDFERNEFSNSKVYVRSNLENIRRLQLQYEMAESELHRNAISQLVTNQLDSFDKDYLTDDLLLWVESL